MIKNNINKIPTRKTETMNDDADNMEENVSAESENETKESPVQEYFDSLTDEEKQELCDIVEEYKITIDEDSEEEIDLNELTKESPESTED